MSNNPASKQEWRDLIEHAKQRSQEDITFLFSNDEDRFKKFSTSIDGLYFDYSKQNITKDTIEKLCSLAQACDIQKRRDAMFAGDPINITEKRAALHTALRRPTTDQVTVSDQDIIPHIHNALQRMQDFSNACRNGEYKGATDKKFTHAICMGTGGSDLGPRMVNAALHNHTKQSDFETLFVANIDGYDIQQAIKKCNPETTLIIILSKSFGTQETLTNAKYAQRWLANNLPSGSDIFKQIVAVTGNDKAAQDAGISESNIFPIDDWVNGRFSLWSCVGLPICLKFGFSTFSQLLSGAYAMDQHFTETPLEENIPILLALIGIWNRNFLGYNALSILPYLQRFYHLPGYLQQLEMESNGKMVDLDNNVITDYQTAPFVFGEVGTNGQHSFYQLFHQGGDIVPCDFIGIVEAPDGMKDHHQLLLHNMLAQSQAMMQGAQEPDPSQKYRHFDGSRPSSTLLLQRANAYHLGMLIALYEHKCFVQGVIWNINSFDQFGVELGKKLSRKLDNHDLSGADLSTKGLFSLIHKSIK